MALSCWRKDNDYAVVCCPYFQYPSKQSQIYAQSLENNVCPLSWEHLIFLMENNIKESTDINFSNLWNFCKDHSSNVFVSNRKQCFIPTFNRIFSSFITKNRESFDVLLQRQIETIISRASIEIQYWNDEKQHINSLSREQAIIELLKAKKYDEKIFQIESYISHLKRDSK